MEMAATDESSEQGSKVKRALSGALSPSQVGYGLLLTVTSTSSSKGDQR